MKRIQVIAGHYGSGKSEVSVNLVLALKEKYEKVTLGDLDIVNVYFRSREKADFLLEKGIQVYSSSLGHVSTLDLPAVSAKIRTSIFDPETQVVLDVGGDPAGSRVLGLFREDLKKTVCDFLCVINANRPETSDGDRAVAMMKKIEAVAGMTFTGLISNTHMLHETTREDVEKGIQVCREIQKIRNIPLQYICVRQDLIHTLDQKDDPRLLSIGEILREEWMK